MDNSISSVNPYTQAQAQVQPQNVAPAEVAPPENNTEPAIDSGVSGVSPNVPDNSRLIDTYG